VSGGAKLLTWFLFCITSGCPVYLMLRNHAGGKRLLIGYLSGAGLSLVVTAVLCMGAEARHASSASVGGLLGTGVALAVFGPFMTVPFARSARLKKQGPKA